MLTLLLISLLTLALNIPTANTEPTTVVVPDDYSTIREAANRAKPGDLIYVRAGTYFEKQVTINKPLTLLGENENTTVIDGDGTWVCVYIQSTHDVNVSGFTIQNGYGIYLYHSKNVVISGNIISNNRQGTILLESIGNSIAGNNIVNNAEGISLNNSSNNVIGENNVTNSLLHGIGLELSDDNRLVQNDITDTYYWGIEMHSSDNNTITGNNLVDTINGSAILVGDSRINKIYYNNFINNNISHAFVYGSYRTVWDDDYPSGGNYWSDHLRVDDYSGINQDDAGSDGIVDEPYIIDEENQDNYPLVEPWSPEPSDPLKALEKLIGTLETEDLPKGTENSLSSKLKGAIHLLDIGNENGAIHKLMAFINHVEGLRGKKLTDDQTDYLIAEVQRIINLIEG
jgi:parallel beta-helix repeat protein